MRSGAGGTRDVRRERADGPEQPVRPPRETFDAPDIPEDVTGADLDRAARGRLRTLSKDNAEGVAQHLVMAGRLLDHDPEEAYRHAQAAVRRAGRVDVVREAAAITAYRTGRYAEALRELRTVRRLNGSNEHLPLMADCERGLGRPERAIALAQEEAARTLPADVKAELAIVISGARLDLGQPEAAVATLRGLRGRVPVEQAQRVTSALADALEAAGDAAQAARLRATLPAVVEDEELVVYDLEDDVADVGGDERHADDEDARDAGGPAGDDSLAVDEDAASAPDAAGTAARRPRDVDEEIR